MSQISHPIIALAETLEQRWENYRQNGEFDLFVEFTLSLNGLTEQLHRRHLPGLVRACQELENTALALFGDNSMHPIPIDQANGIGRQLSIIISELGRHEAPEMQMRRGTDASSDDESWYRPRDVLIVARVQHPWNKALGDQLAFFGFHAKEIRWNEDPATAKAPLVMTRARPRWLCSDAFAIELNCHF